MIYIIQTIRLKGYLAVVDADNAAVADFAALDGGKLQIKLNMRTRPICKGSYFTLNQYPKDMESVIGFDDLKWSALPAGRRLASPK